MKHLRAHGRLALLLVSTFCLALLARQRSRESALDSWLAEHPPDRRIWALSLETYRLRSCAHPEQLHRALRTLPARAEDLHEVWCSADLQWVAVSHDRGEPTLYARNCATRPEGWKPCGKGWVALRQVDRSLQDLPRPQQAFLPPEGDGREIRY